MIAKNKFILILLVLSVLLLQACSEKKTVYRKSRTLMDTIVTVTVVSDSAEKAEKAIDDAFGVMGRFAELINFFSDGSELSSINRNAGIGPVKVSPDTLGVIERALYISRISDGAFDFTIGPEIRLWDFFKKIKPSDAEIRKNLSFVNYRNVVLDKAGSTVFLKNKGMLMDLGGIAKGYAADLALAQLKREGVRAGIVAAAGDIRAFGLKPDRSRWHVGIQNPRQTNESDEVIAEMELTDKAVSTSGDYQRFFIEDGRRYHHILDPLTGYPAGGCRSVTVISDKGIFADGFSTAVFVSGPEKGMQLAEKYGVDAVIIDSNGQIHTTPGIKRNLKIEEGHQ